MALDRERELQRLSEIDRHIAEAEVAITRQVVEIDKLQRDGRDTSAEEAALTSLERSLEIMRTHRQEIISSIGEIDKE